MVLKNTLEEKTKQYQSYKDIDPQSLVYIDESDIDMTICKDKVRGKRNPEAVWQKQ